MIGASLLLARTLATATVAFAAPAPTAPPPAAAAPVVDPSQEPAAPNSTQVVSDGPVTVSTRITPNPSNVGDRLTLEVVAAYPRDVRVNLPTKLSFEPLHHIQTIEGEPESTGDGLRKTFEVRLQHFETGEAAVPGFDVTYVDAEGGIHTVQVPSVPFEVEALLANEDEPERRGEDPPISREYPDTRAEIVLWSVLATLLLALIAWLVVRRLRARTKVEVGPPPIPAHELAFEALDELEQGELLQNGEVQRYYVELTEIAKGYVQRRFGVLALDRTTDEIRQALMRDTERVAPLSADDLIEFLEECDLVKFARMQPPDDDARQALGTVRTMVEGSIARDEPPEPEPEPEPAADSTSTASGAEPTAAEPSGAEATAEPSSDDTAADDRETPGGTP